VANFKHFFPLRVTQDFHLAGSHWGAWGWAKNFLDNFFGLGLNQGLNLTRAYFWLPFGELGPPNKWGPIFQNFSFPNNYSHSNLGFTNLFQNTIVGAQFWHFHIRNTIHSFSQRAELTFGENLNSPKFIYKFGAVLTPIGFFLGIWGQPFNFQEPQLGNHPQNWSLTSHFI